MKRTWDPAELEEHWTLSTDECQAALDNKIEANRLGFALLLKERVKAAIAQAKAKGRFTGRPQTVGKRAAEVTALFAHGVSQAEIARRLSMGRTSVRRLLKTTCR